MGPLYNNKICPICSANTFVLRNRMSRLTENGNIDNNIIMKILDLKSIHNQLCFCPTCFHLYRNPLYDELVVNNKYYKEKEEVIKGMSNILQKPSFGSIMTDSEMRLLALKGISGFLSSIDKYFDNIKILDWGGGSGIKSHILALLLDRAGLTAKAFSYDIQSFVNHYDDRYINYVNLMGVKQNSPYDVILFSHVLEHVAFPAKILKEASQYLSKDGIIVILLPYEQESILSKNSVYLNAHQHMYSRKSMENLLKSAGYKHVEVGCIDTINRHWVVNNEKERNQLGKTFIQKNIIGYGTSMPSYSGQTIKKMRFIFTKSILDIFFQMTSKVLNRLFRYLR